MGDGARNIGRGALLLTLSKFYFLAGSYVIYFALPHVGDSRGDVLLGDFKAAGSFLSVIGTVLVMGTTQAVARFVGRDPAGALLVQRRGLALEALLGLVMAGLFFVAAPWIAGDTPRLIAPLRVAAGIPFVYAMYAVSMGTLNGSRQFARQATVDATFTTLKVVLVLLAVKLTGSAAGAYGGFLAAAILAFGLASFWTRPSALRSDAIPASVPTWQQLLAFQLQTVGFMLLVQWVVQLDIWYVTWFSQFDVGARVPLPGSDPPLFLDQESATRNVYAGVQLFSQISYSLVISVTFVLFPLISSLGDDREGTRAYVREALRYGAMLVLGATAVVSANPEATIGLLLREPELNLGLVTGRGEALRWLGLGYVAFALLFILCSVLNAAGRVRVSVGLMALVGVIQVAVGYWAVPLYGPSGQGIAGLVAMGVGLLAALWFFARWVGSVLVPLSFIRIVLAAGCAYTVGVVWDPPGKVATLGRFLIAGVVYGLALVLTGEFGAEDRARFRRVLPGGKKRG